MGDNNVRISTTLLCAWYLNPTTPVSVASDLIYMYIFVLTVLIIVIVQNVKENEKEQNKVSFAKFNPKKTGIL